MGRVVIELTHSRTLSPEEQRFADWIEERADDVTGIFSTLYPEDGTPPIDLMSLCIEERLPDGRIAVQCLDVGHRGFTEVWEHMEKIARIGLERVKEENPCA